MFEFMYKAEFFRYLGAFSGQRAGQKVPIVAPFIAFYLLALLGIFFGISSQSVTAALVAFASCALFLAGTILGVFRNIKPNVSMLMPISYKRRFLYDFLGVIYYATVGIVIGSLVVLFFAGIGILIAVLSGSASPDVEEGSELVFNATGVHGGIFCVAYAVMLYSAGLISGYFKKRKFRNIFLVVFVFTVALMQFIPFALYNSIILVGSEENLASPFIEKCYEAMSLPWLYTVISCLCAAGLFVAALYMGYKYHKPKNY